MNKILVIDDEEDMRETISEILTMNDYEVVLAENGDEGIEKAKAFNPGIIICDVNMPKKNGFEVLEEIRKSKELQSTQFIFLTYKSDREHFRKGMNLSADDYLTKPFRANELLDAVKARIMREEQIINSSLEKFKNLEENMKDFFRDGSIPDIKNLEETINDLKSNVKRKDFQIQNFSFITSHALRSSIVNIFSSLELAKEKQVNYNDILSTIGKSTDSLEKMIKDLNIILNEDVGNNFNKIKFNEKKKIKRIYLLDDEEIQLLFNKHLILKFFPDKEVETYSDPEEMLKNLKNSKELPDKLFLDLFMPELTGWEVLEILEQNSINIDVTIISSSIDPRDMEKASKYSNVSSYITKPLSPEKIKEELKVH